MKWIALIAIIIGVYLVYFVDYKKLLNKLTKK